MNIFGNNKFGLYVWTDIAS